MARDQLPQTELRGRMLASAETQAGIKDNHRLVFPGSAAAPGWFDQQPVAKLHGLEVAFP